MYSEQSRAVFPGTGKVLGDGAASSHQHPRPPTSLGRLLSPRKERSSEAAAPLRVRAQRQVRSSADGGVGAPAVGPGCGDSDVGRWAQPRVRSAPSISGCPPPAHLCRSPTPPLAGISLRHTASNPPHPCSIASAPNTGVPWCPAVALTVTSLSRTRSPPPCPCSPAAEVRTGRRLGAHQGLRFGKGAD